MRIVVTGGSGLVGRAIVRCLAQHHDVVNVDLSDPTGVARSHSTRVERLSGEPEPPAQYAPASILDLAALSRAIDGAQAVVHAAAIPGPAFGSEDDILNVNVEGTRNVAIAADRAGVQRLVFISSDSVLGFVFSEGRVRPRYLPVDEAHPLAPVDAYGRSKLMAETVLAGQAAKTATVISLRPPWIWVPEEYEKLRRLTRTPAEWPGGLWAYVHGDDLARAVERAVTLDIEPGFHAAYVAAPDNGTVVPTSRLLDDYFPGIPVHQDLPEFGSLMSSSQLESLLSFKPTMSWREFL
ncbi:MAG: NAD(P)-dependent oxidoreductase [Candidatus Eisenbacteria bacterium]|nr:NAD(P)-dependent oxidoreductase [Candidatus Eisenbacteria bacterium]